MVKERDLAGVQEGNRPQEEEEGGGGREGHGGYVETVFFTFLIFTRLTKPTSTRR